MLCGSGDDPIDAGPPSAVFNPRELAAIGSRACAVLPDERIYCWGCNGLDELGTADRSLRENSLELP